MEKISERWSPDGITSVFKFKREGDHLLCLDNLVASEVCGFGWRFVARRKNDSDGVLVGFDRFLVSRAAFGLLTVSGPGGFERQYPFPRPIGEPDVPTFFAGYKTSFIIKYPVVGFTVKLPSSLGFTLPISISSSMMQVLNKSLVGDEINDTKLYVFSCRSTSGRACRPRSLFANRSLLLGRSPYFNACQSSNGTINPFPITEFMLPVLSEESMIVDPLTAMPEILQAEYDYDSDSDLEDDEYDPDVMDQSSASSSMIIDHTCE
jgi:hypothetical protein